MTLGINIDAADSVLIQTLSLPPQRFDLYKISFGPASYMNHTITKNDRDPLI